MILKSLNHKGTVVRPAIKYESLEDILTSSLTCRQVTKKTSIDDPQFHINLADIEKNVPGLCLKFLTDIQYVSQVCTTFLNLSL